MSVDDLYEVVRRGDRENFLCLLVAPEPARRDLLILTAFDLELARVHLAAREPLLAAMRWTWWRDETAKALDGRTAGHPILAALAEANARRALDRRLVERLVSARETGTPDGALHELWLDALGVADAASRRAAILIGTAQGSLRRAAAAGAVLDAQGLRDRLVEARGLRKDVDKRAIPALLPARLVDARLRDPHGRGVFDPLRVALGAMTGRY